MKKMLAFAIAVLLSCSVAGAAELSYSYGSTNTTYHFRPLYVTATEGGATIWQMKIWVPEDGYAQSHAVASAGEIAEFKDVQHGGTPFNYSPEGSTYSWSPGLMKMGEFQGDFSDTGGQATSYYRFTKTATLATGITSVLTVTINAPTVYNGGYHTSITGTYQVTNTSGATYSLWGCTSAGAGTLALATGGYTNWAFVNPTAATTKPNVHNTDSTDGHQLYLVEDWYGSTVTSDLPGLLCRMTVKDNATAAALNMRPGLTFELRADDMSFYYADLANRVKGSASASATNGVRCYLDREQGIFGNGATLPDGQSITMNWAASIAANGSPAADAGADQVVHDSDASGAETVTLNGAASDDPDGDIVSWVWTEGATTVATGETAQAALAVGTHTITLTVTDDDGATASDTVQIIVNAAPVADAGDDQSVTDTDGGGDETVTLDGTGSSDADGTMVSYTWKEGATTIATGATAEVSLELGTHTITLEVTDNLGGTASDTVVVDVLAPTTGTLTYAYGTTNTTYHYRPLTITASLLGSNIWQMKVWVPEAGYLQSHGVASAGEIAGFWDLQHGGTAFNYSPEGSTHSWSPGLMRVGSFEGDFSDSGGQQEGYYQFTKTFTIATGITGTLTMRINAPEVGDDDFVTSIEATYTVTNTSGAAYSLWGCTQAGTSSLALAHGGYTTWAMTNAFSSTAKPNVHNTDTTDGHQLYTVYDWYGSYVTSDLPGSFSRLVVKDNAQTAALNMRPGLTFELRGDDCDLYYVDVSNGSTSSSAISSTNGVRCLFDRQQGVFGSGATLANGASISLVYTGTISTLPLPIPPIARAGADVEVDDDDLDGYETVTLDGSTSVDADGSIVSYVWMEGATTLATSATADVSFAVGTHTVTLYVTDDDNITDSDTLVIVVTSSAPVTYYVAREDANASDSNPGTEALPLATIGAAMALLGPGDTVIVKQGIYRETVTVPVSGTEQLPITLQANAGDRVVVAGSDAITGWTQLPQNLARGNPNYQNIYYTDINWVPPRVDEDGVELGKARTPNTGWWFVGSGSDPTHIVDMVNLTQADSSYWVNATMFFVNKTPVQDQEVLITAFDAATDTVTLAAEVATNGDTGPVAGQDTYYMSNKLELIDVPGEYAIESLGGGQYRLFVWPTDNGSAANHLYEGCRRSGPVLGWGANDWITVDGFEVRGSTTYGTGLGTSTSGSTDITIRNCVVHANEYMGIHVSGGTRITICNNISTDNGYGVAVSTCTDVLVAENDISKNNVDGLVVSYTSSDIHVERNYIHDHILWGHPDNMQTHNGVTDMWVEDNVIISSGQTFMIEGTTGLHFINNMFVGSAAVMLHGGATNQELDGNTLAFSGYVMCSLGSTGYDFTNNIFYKGHSNILYAATSTQSYTSNYNVFFQAPGITESVIQWNGVRPAFATYVSQSGQDTNSYYANPLFVNAPQYYERMYHYGVPYYTTTRVYMDSTTLFVVDDHIELDFDGVVRIVTAVGSDGVGAYLEFSPALAKPLVLAGVVANWKTNTDYDLDLRVQNGSPALGNGENGRDIGCDLDIQAYRAGDLDGDNVRDIPDWPPEE